MWVNNKKATFIYATFRFKSDGKCIVYCTLRRYRNKFKKKIISKEQNQKFSLCLQVSLTILKYEQRENYFFELVEVKPFRSC